MTYDFWQKTGMIKPFTSIEQFEKYEADLCKLPKLDMYANTALKKSKIKKGVNILSEKFDSFAEFTLVQYMRLIKGYVVERNKKMYFLTYVDQNGKVCKFYPDFVINGKFAECKGKMSDKDLCKLQQCPEVEWYFQSEIEIMSKELNKAFPDWRSEFIQTN